MVKKKNEEHTWEVDNRKRTIILGYWTVAWMFTLALATFGPKLLWEGNGFWSSLAIAINTLIGFGMIWANKNHLKGLDEMQQKIQLEAMGVTLGVGLVLGLSYSTVDIANLITYDAEISHLVILLGITYIAATLIGRYRYR